MKIENKPDLKDQTKILDHHPHHGFPQHGEIRKFPLHMRGKVTRPGRERKAVHER
jgi:hypothetical protein